jgi:PAS domain S-box-containing protein
MKRHPSVRGDNLGLLRRRTTREDRTSEQSKRKLASAQTDSTDEAMSKILEEIWGKFQSIYDSSNECYMYLDKFGKILDVNKKTVEVFGGSEKDLVGRHFTRVSVIPARDIPELINNFRKIMSGKKAFINLEFRNKNDQLVHLECSANLVKSQGRTQGITVVARDVSGRKRAESGLRESQARYSALFNEARDGILLVEGKSGKIVDCNPEFERQTGISRKRLLNMRIWELQPSRQRKGAKRKFLKLVARKERATTVLEARSPNGEMASFELRSKVILIGGTKYLQTIVRDITDRVRFEEELRVSEERYRDIVEAAADGIVTTDLKGVVTSCNDEFVKQTGHSKDGIVGKYFSSLPTLRKRDIPKYIRLFASALKGNLPKPFEMKWRRRDGRVRSGEMRISLMRKGESVVGLLGIIRDTTERHQAERAIRASERKYRSLVDNALVGVFKTSLDGRLLFANEALANILGFSSAKELMSEGVLPMNRDPGKKGPLMDGLTKGGKVEALKVEVSTKMGDVKTVLLSASLEGNTISGIATDVTELKETERALVESEERYSTLVENSADGIIIIQDGTLKFANKASVDFVGVNPDQMIGSDFLEFVSPEHRETVLRRYMGRMAGEEVPNIYEIELQRRDGSKMPVEVNVEVIEYEGRPAELVFIRNIIDRKKVEEEMRRSEERLKIMFEYAPDAYYLSDFEGRFVDGNKAAEELIGRKKEELIGDDFLSSGILSSEYAERALEALVKNINGDPTGPDEFVLNHEDGSQITAEIRTFPVKINGEDRVLGIARDITQRKEAETALRKSEEKFRALVENSVDIYLVLDNEGKLDFASPSIQKVLGYNPEDLIGGTSFDFAHPDDLDRILDSFANLIENPGQPITIEFRARDTDGDWHTVEATGCNLLDNPAVNGVVVNFHDITERKEADEALRESEEKFRSLADHSPNMICITKGETIVYANNECEEIVGYTKEELCSPSFEFMRLVSPESRDTVTASSRWHMKGKDVPPYEVVILNREGDKTDAIISTKIIRYEGETAVLAVVTDITERKRWEEEIKKSEERYRFLAENVTDVIFTTDMNLNFTYITPSVGRLLGYTVDELLDLRLEDFVAPSSPQAAVEVFKERISEEIEDKDTGTLQLELELMRKDRSRIWIQSETTVLRDETGKPTGLLGVAHDVTQLRETIKNLERANQELQNAQAQLIQSEKLASIGTLASGVAHEINNPLAAVTGYAEIIMDQGDSDFTKKCATKIVDAAGRASDVVRWLSRHARQAKDAQIVDIRLNDVLSDSLEAMRLTRSSPDIEVEKEFTDVPLIRGNQNELQQIFVNLLNNSADAMPNGGRITASTKDSGDVVEVAISDTGEGIPEEHLKKVFDPFFTTKEVGEGTGLGLYVVSMIVNKHHGTIDVSSEPGKGSTFTLRFPTKQPDSEPTTEQMIHLEANTM